MPDERARSDRAGGRRVAIVLIVLAVLAALAASVVLGRLRSLAPSPVPAPVAVDLGPPGSVILGRATGARLDFIRSGADATETPVATIRSLDVALGDWGLPAPPRGLLGPAGALALAVDQLPGGRRATAVIDLTRPAAGAAIVGAGSFAFLPDGTLVIAPGDEASAILRYARPWTGPALRTAVPAGVDVARLSLLADGSGVIGTQPADPRAAGIVQAVREVAVGWDGTVRDVDPAADPILATGLERLTGAHGETAVAWAETTPGVEGGGVAIVSPTRDRINLPIDGGPLAWLPGGRTLVILQTTGGLAADHVLASWDGADVRSVPVGGADVPADEFVGLTPELALFRSGANRVWRVRLDGSQSIALDGFLAGIVR